MIDSDSIQAFKRQYHLARKAREALESQNLGFTLKANMESQQGEVGITGAPAEQLCRFATNIEPLADPDSRLNYKRVARMLVELPEATSDTDSKTLLGKVDTASPTMGPQLSFNGKDYRSQDLHRLLARGGFFAEDDGCRDELRQLLTNPVAAKLVWFSFFSYAGDVLKLCDVVYSVIRIIEKDNPGCFTNAEVIPEGPCIYCDKTDGGFTAVEHIYPESLGNTERSVSTSLRQFRFAFREQSPWSAATA